MMLSIESRKRELDAYFDRAKSTAISDEYRSDLGKFGAVLVCGFIEKSIATIIMDRLNKKAHPRVIGFIKSHFNRGTNYDCEAICQLLERFDRDWSNNFREFLSKNVRLNEIISSTYTVRNSVAHGGSGNQGITSVITAYQAAQEVINSVELITR